jgi:ketosteroid isomerase-like protein
MVVDDSARQESSDRAEIRFTLERYFSGIDARDAERIASCFTPDAWMSYSLDLEGKSRIDCSYVEWEKQRSAGSGGSGMAATNHDLTSCHIEIEGDTARSDTFAMVHLVEHPVTNGRVLIRGLRYLDELRLTETGWRITERVHQTVFQYEARTVAPAVPGR